MSVDAWNTLVQWWLALTPAQLFLFALPFGVAAAGLLAAWWQARRDRPTLIAAAPRGGPRRRERHPRVV